MSVTSEIISIIKDVVTIISLGIGAYIALNGLNTWKRQLTVQAEYNLARRLLIAVYKFRDAIHSASASIKVHIEVFNVTDKYTDISKESIKEDFAELENTDANLKVELLEAETTWGDDPQFNSLIRNLTFKKYPLNSLRDKYLFSNIEDIPEENKTADITTMKEFGQEVREAVRHIENLLRPKLKLTSTKVRKRKFWKRRKQK